MIRIPIKDPVRTITLLSEKEVFGFTKEEEKIVEVLKKCKIPGDYRGDKLRVLQERGLFCQPTDLVLILGGNNDCYCLKNPSDDREHVLTYSNSHNWRNYVSTTDRSSVIRPVLNIPEDIDIGMIEDCSEIEYGEYPQFVANLDMQEKLEQELINNSDKIEVTNEYYSIVTESIYWPSSEIHPVQFPVFSYEGKKYIRIPKIKSYEKTLSNGIQVDKYDHDYFWVEVSPVKWIIDKSSRKLISKNGLVTNVPFARYGLERYSLFTGSQVYDFLKGYFFPEIVQSLTTEDTKRNIY